MKKLEKRPHPGNPYQRETAEKCSEPASYLRFSTIFFDLGALFILSISSSSETPYLRSVGPAPLRFRADAKPYVRKVDAPLPPAAKPELPVPTTNPVATTVPAPGAPLEPSPPSENVTTNTEPAQSDGVISPRMLLKYFNKSTNGAAPGVVAPIDFLPPRAGDPPSSKAEYSTPPH